VDLMPSDLIYHAYIDAEGRPRVEPGPLLHHGVDLAVFFFNEINRARPQVQSLLLRVMAERSVRAFNRDSALPFVTVFADRNRVEREETFELAAAARDRFMIEVSVDAPVDDDLRWRLISEPQFHDVDQLLERVPRALVDFRSLREGAAAIQRSVRASDALRRYALALWDTLNRPAAHGLVLEGADVGRLLLAGPSPARRLDADPDRARASLARGARLPGSRGPARSVARSDDAPAGARPGVRAAPRRAGAAPAGARA
jgi:MoxR-like ATPase